MLKNQNFYPYAFKLDDTDVDCVQNILNQIAKDNTVILYWYEPNPVDDVCFAIHTISNQCDLKIIWLLTESFYDEASKNKIYSANVDVVFLEFDLLSLYFELYTYKSSQLNQQWNSDSDKFLFLTGKPNRANRTRLLYKFSNQGLMSQCVWSFFMDQNLKNKSRSLLPELNDQEYEKFISSHLNNPDKIDVLYGSGGSSHYDGYPFDSQLYEKTLFRVISETYCWDQPIVTEKTWVTIANQQPFMIVGYQNNLAALKNLGYRTFEKYCKIDHYDSISDQEQRLDAVVENTEDWLTTIKKHQRNILIDIDHNYTLLTAEMNKTFEKFLSIYRRLQPTEYEIFRILETTTQRNKWTNFYYHVKSADWPDCFVEENFCFLPLDIQKECIEVHGYCKIN